MKYLIQSESGKILQPGVGPMTRPELNKALERRLSAYKARCAAGHDAKPDRVRIILVSGFTPFTQQVTAGVVIPN